MSSSNIPQHSPNTAPTSPSKPPAPPDAASKSSTAFRVALFCAVGAFLVLFLMKENSSVRAEAKRTEQAGAEHWLKEIDDYVSRIPCRFPDNVVARARAQELPKSLQRWEELARIEPSEYLKSLIRVQELTTCGHSSDLPEDDSVESASARLREKLSQRIRTQYALLLRAQKQGERQDALRAVNSLLVLLSAHEGPARTHLEKLARHFR